MDEDYNKYFADPHEVSDNGICGQKDEIAFKIDFNLEEYDFAVDLNQSQEKSTHSNEFFLQKLDEQSASRTYLEDKTCSKHSSFLANKTKIFNIVRDDQPQNSNNEDDEEELMISQQTKPINKKEKVKTKHSVPGFPDVDSSWVNKQIEEEMKEYQHLDEKSKKKMVQMLRNRISAQTSRDRKKYYVGCLEKENQELKVQNTKLRSKIKELEDSGAGYAKEFICKYCKRSENASSTGMNFLETNSTREMNDIEIRTNSVGHSPGRLYTFFALLSVVMLIGLVSNNYDGGVAIRTKPMHLEEIRVLSHDEPISPVENSKDNLLSQDMCCRNHQINGPNSERLIRKIKEMQALMDAQNQKDKRDKPRQGSRRNVTNTTNKQKFLAVAENPLQPYHFEETSESLYCPSAILLEQIQERLKYLNHTENLVKRFEITSELQILVPTKNISSLKTAQYKAKRPDEQEVEDDEVKILEMRCNLNTVREFTA